MKLKTKTTDELMKRHDGGWMKLVKVRARGADSWAIALTLDGYYDAGTADVMLGHWAERLGIPIIEIGEPL